MRWFPDLANAAFCETVELRRKILEGQLSRNSSARLGLEPSSAEFIASLAAGNNSHIIVQVGCGISTIALAAAAQTTGGLLLSIHTDESKQDIARYHVNYLGLVASVEFLVASKPSNVLLSRKNVDFAYFTGDPKDYIQLFDSLNLNYKAIVAADNALSESSNEYLQHVRRQPGMESYTLPLAKGIEVAKVASWEKFKSGRTLYSGLRKDVMKERDNGIHSGLSAQTEATTSMFLSGDEKSINNEAFLSLGEKASLVVSSIRIPDETFTSCDTCSGKSNLNSSDTQDSEVTPVNSVVGDVSISLPTCLIAKKSLVEANNSADPSVTHDNSNSGDDGGVLNSACSSVYEVHFQNYSNETEVTITGVNRDMLLSDITTAFSDMGISVKTANIETHDDLIEDTFYVTDARSGAPLDPSQWGSLEDWILQRIGKKSVK